MKRSRFFVVVLAALAAVVVAPAAAKPPWAGGGGDTSTKSHGRWGTPTTSSPTTAPGSSTTADPTTTAQPTTTTAQPTTTTADPTTTTAQPTTTTAQPTTTTSPPPPPGGNRAGIASAYTLLYESQSDMDRDLDSIVAAGGTWLRFDVAWSIVERNHGVYDWSTIDRLVNDAHARGLHLLGTLAYTPGWAQPAGVNDDHYAPVPSADSAYAAFAGAAAARYAGSVHDWEVWNEENTNAFWEPTADPSAYSTLLSLAGPAIRRTPGAAVVLGGLAASGPQWGGITQSTFINAIYSAGAGGAFDILGVHATSLPYMPDDPSTASWNVLWLLPSLHSQMAAHGDDKQVWVTEYGYPSAGRVDVSESKQAAAVTGAYKMVDSYPSWCGPLFWYTPRDKAAGSPSEDDNYGLVRRDFSQKPAWSAYHAYFS